MSLTQMRLLLLSGAMVLLGGALSGGDVQAEGAAPGSSEIVEVQTDLNGARQMAQDALRAGRNDLAIEIARQILAVIPGDVPAHLILSAALTRTGQAEAAVPVAKAGFRLAETPAHKFESAYLAAEGLAAQGKVWASKLWLRRADLHAPDDPAKAALRNAYGLVSTRTPLSFGMSVFAGPSDNVNGGSLHDTFLFMGIPIPIDQALPGWVAGGTIELRYALPGNAQAKLSWSHRAVILGDEAKAINPTARASDYAQDEVGLGLQKVWSIGNGQAFILASGSVGRRWTGGEHSTDVARADLGVFRNVSDTFGAGLRFRLEDVHYPDRPTSDSFSRQAVVTLRHLGTSTGQVTLDLGAKDVASDAAGIAWRGPTIALGWTPELKSEDLGLSLQFAVEQRDYWRSPGIGDDLKMGLSATAELKSLDFMGFNPTVTLSAARTRSDVVVRDTSDLGVSFGVSSSF